MVENLDSLFPIEIPQVRYILSHTIDGNPPQHSSQEVHRMLEATQGAWGRGKTLEEIDAEIDRMRAEWDRDARRT
jgi:hypothetical protein